MDRHSDVVMPNAGYVYLRPVEAKELILSGKYSLVEKEQATAVAVVALGKSSCPAGIIKSGVFNPQMNPQIIRESNGQVARLDGTACQSVRK